MADPSRLPEVRADLEKTCLSGGGAEFTQAVAVRVFLTLTSPQVCALVDPMYQVRKKVVAI